MVERFLAQAPTSGIDPDLIWAAGEFDPPGGPIIRQAVLAVPGSGRTATLFISGPRPEEGVEAWGQQADRVACLEAVCAELGPLRTPSIALAQALIDPSEGWSIDALRAAGFTSVGLLEYMSRPMEAPGPVQPPAWPAGVTVTPLSERGPQERWWPLMLRALESSYIDTLDCPELCGLRATEDVLGSHRATGRFDPRFWWLVEHSGEPAGCCLLSLVPQSRSVELVYMGVAPRVRGLGLGRALLSHGLRAVSRLPADEVTLAIDTRNAPAARLYGALGFRATAMRHGFVRRLGG